MPPRRKAPLGLRAAGRKREHAISGELVDHQCQECRRSVLAPADATRVTCWRCTANRVQSPEALRAWRDVVVNPRGRVTDRNPLAELET